MAILRGTYRGVIPKINWGPAMANAITFDRPLDDAITDTVEYARPESVLSMDGLESDGYTLKEYGVLHGTVHRIPRLNSLGITGWEGTTGWDEFLKWARQPNAFRFYPDAGGIAYWTCYLPDDFEEGHDEEPNRMRMLRLSLRQADNATFSGY